METASVLHQGCIHSKGKHRSLEMKNTKSANQAIDENDTKERKKRKKMHALYQKKVHTDGFR
jgi:hypothetical protein